MRKKIETESFPRLKLFLLILFRYPIEGIYPYYPLLFWKFCFNCDCHFKREWGIIIAGDNGKFLCHKCSNDKSKRIYV